MVAGLDAALRCPDWCWLTCSRARASDWALALAAPQPEWTAEQRWPQSATRGSCPERRTARQAMTKAQNPGRGLPVSDDAVILRRLTPHDRALFQEARTDPTIAYRFGIQRTPLDDQIQHFMGLFETGEGVALTIAPHQQTAVGAIFLEQGDSGCGNIGYWVLSQHRGQGYATRGLRLAARWALQSFDWARLQLWIEPDNQWSLRVAEAAGFIREGVLRSYSVIEGRRCDAVFFSLLPTDGAYR
jgi:[ribosomal protein S5]-alanine N-acetyltransferase